MIKRFIFLLVLFLTACKPNNGDDRVVMKVGDIPVTLAEYRQAYTHSPYFQQDTVQSRKKFLESYAMRLMILQVAQEEGVDRDSEFLKDVEFFWQQALIKRMLEKKMSDLAANVTIDDAKVKEYYDLNQEAYFKDKSFDEVERSIRSFLMAQSQSEMLETWLTALRGKSKVKINKTLTGLQ